MMHPAPFYAPPYATRALDEFAWHVVKVLDLDCGFFYDVPEEMTGCGAAAQFVVERMTAEGLRRVVVQVTESGDAFAETDADRALVDGGFASALYRVRASDVVLRIADILHVVGQWEPGMLSYRGRVNLERLAHRDILMAVVDAKASVFVHDLAPGLQRVGSDVFGDTPPPLPPLVIHRVLPCASGDDYALPAAPSIAKRPNP